MSASSTWWPPFAPRFRRVSSAIVALRFGRKPYEHGRKSASKTGSSTSFAAICATRSRTVGMPSGRFFPSAFGMYRRRTTLGRYVPARSSAPSSSRKRSTPCCSTSRIVWLSTPAAPLFRFTRFHASCEDVTPPDVVVQRVEASSRRSLGRGPEPALQLSHFCRAAYGRRGR